MVIRLWSIDVDRLPQGLPVIAGDIGFGLGVHRSVNEDGYDWTVSDRITGAAIDRGFSRRDAVRVVWRTLLARMDGECSVCDVLESARRRFFREHPEVKLNRGDAEGAENNA